MRTFILKPDNAKPRMAAAWAHACEYLELGQAVRVEVSECKATRSIEQNSRLWALLTDVSRQVDWPVDGKLQKLPAEDWKDIFTASLKKEQRVAQGLEGGFVMLGSRTSKMTVGEMIDLQTLIEAFGAEHGVRWGDERLKA